MPALQTSFSERLPVGAVGALANMENWNSISRICAAAVAFGALVVQGVDDLQVSTAGDIAQTVGTPTITGTGNGSIGTPTADPGADPGTWKVEIIEPAANGGVFQVVRPNGTIESNGAIGVAYNGEINFTLADGATDFLAGDVVNVPVIRTGGGLVRGIAMRDITVPPGNNDGYLQYNVAAILTKGIIWVTAGATVVAGDPVYFDADTGRYTNVEGENILVPDAIFDSSSTNGNLVKVRLNQIG